MLRLLLFVFTVCLSESQTVVEVVGTCPVIVNSSCPDSEYVQFKLYTRSTQKDGEVLDLVATNISESQFQHSLPTKIVVHGFTNNANETDLVELRQEYLKKGEYNIITVDYAYLAQGPEVCYPTATDSIQHVGECTGQLIQRLRAGGATDVHVIGHSLGAQVAHWVAGYVNPKLARITGLDPANPLFNDSRNVQIQKTDADFVDIIHTNANIFGILEAVGDVDFYMNGGTIQPGCDADAACSHRRSVEYFAESIRSEVGFYGKACSSVLEVMTGLCDTSSPRTILMGDSVDHSTTGIIGVPTGSASPYALGREELRYAESQIFYNGSCPLVMGTACPDNKYVQFKLYTRTNPTASETIDLVLNNLAKTAFKATIPTKIIIHGFNGSETLSYHADLRSAYLTKGSYNVIMVDWSFLAQGPIYCYIGAMLNIRHVGECTAKLVQRIRESGANDIHVIGHSLGAQVANFVAKYVTPKIPRVTGLDPAGPFFTAPIPPSAQLDMTDAAFVDVIHTNKGIFGKILPCGHVDFYVNDAVNQPGCGLNFLCSHYRSIEYFTESVSTTTGFYGRKCSSLFEFELGLCTTSARNVLMGENATPATTGVVAVQTKSSWPFAAGN